MKGQAQAEQDPLKVEEVHEEKQPEVFTAETFSNLPLNPKLKQVLADQNLSLSQRSKKLRFQLFYRIKTSC